MNFIDQAIAYIDPEAGVRRLAWRNAMQEAARAYDAGGHDRLNRNWVVSNDSAERTDRYERDIVRARARDLERNSDLMNALIGPYKRNTVGSGYRLQSQTGDEDLNTEIEKLWKRWCKPRNCDVTGSQSFQQILRMAVERKKVDGGILFVKRYTKAGVVPFQIQMFEVDELDQDVVTTNHPNTKVVGGIEYNEYNRPVGYWFKQYDIDGWTMNQPVYVEAKDVVFYYTKRRPSQIREMSDMSQTLTRIRDVNEFMNAVSVKQRIEACLAVFIKRSYPEGGFGRSSNDRLEPRKSYDGKTLSPGMIRELNQGDDVHVVNPNGQSSDATNFVKLNQQIMSAGQGISYEAASRDMSNATYSSARQGIIEDEMTYAEEEEQLINVMDEIYETFLISAVLSGKLLIRNFWDDKEKYFSHEWVKAPKKWIDPVKESNAQRIALATGQKTFKQIAAENGKDWHNQIDEIAEVIEYADSAHGLDLKPIIFGMNQNNVNGGVNNAGTKK